jgi:hypothetical protein
MSLATFLEGLQAPLSPTPRRTRHPEQLSNTARIWGRGFIFTEKAFKLVVGVKHERILKA